jgi:hypothetical protein
MSIFTIPIALLAVLTNVTAIKRLLGAKKTLDGRDAAAGSSSAKKDLVVLGTVVITGLAFTNKSSLHISPQPNSYG